MPQATTELREHIREYFGEAAPGLVEDFLLAEKFQIVDGIITYLSSRKLTRKEDESIRFLCDEYDYESHPITPMRERVRKMMGMADDQEELYRSAADYTEKLRQKAERAREYLVKHQLMPVSIGGPAFVVEPDTASAATTAISADRAAITRALEILAESDSDVKGADLVTTALVVMTDYRGAIKGRDFWKREADEAHQALNDLREKLMALCPPGYIEPKKR